MGMKKYDSITRYGKEDFTDAIIGKRIVVMEKLDGANASFVESNGRLEMFSRNTVVNESNTLRGFFGWASSKLDGISIVRDRIYFGEWLVPHHVQYVEDAYKEFYLFDIFDKETETYLDFDIVKYEAERIGLKMPKVFFDGVINNIEDIQQYVGKSDIAKDYGKGIVVKNYNYSSKFKNHVFVKIVSEKFKEVKGIKQKPLISSVDSLDVFIESVLTNARVDKLIHKKIDLGLLPERLTISDTGVVLKELGSGIVDDIIEEELDVLIALLKKRISRKTPLVVKSVISEKGLACAL